jgi:ketosteroid isomerase-like protein
MSEESATVNTIMEFERETSRLFQAGDVDRMMEYMADDVKLLNPGSELLVGS